MHNPNPPQNLQALVCYSDAQRYLLRYVVPHPTTTRHQTLQIDRRTNQATSIRCLDTIGLKQQSFSAFLGVAKVLDYSFLVFCDECKRASSLQNMETYEVSSLTFLSYEEQERFTTDSRHKEIYQTIRDYYIALKHGFYFSHQYDLTLAYPQQESQLSAINFTWNRHFRLQLQKQGLSAYWTTPLVQGYVGSFELFYQGAKIRYMLVSRRSTQKGGTRYFDRGVDDEGFVANYCETEQIIKVDEYVFSDLQIRGNLPIFFQQAGFYTRTKVNRGFELTDQAFQRHFHKLSHQFKRIFMVNLLSMGKKGQKMLTEAVEEHVKAFPSANLKYLYYDFHHKVKGGKYEMVDEIIETLKPMKYNAGVFIYHSRLNQVLSRQQATFRTNCLDCLDRTNFFQAKLAIITLEKIFRMLKITQLDLLDQMKNNRENTFIRKFRSIWADNGDAISYHYTGTGSTHTDITRDGRRGLLGNIKHKYKTVTRFYNQNFWDFYKMKILNQLLGRNPSQAKHETNKLLQQREQQFISSENIEVHVFTWKAPRSPPKALPPFSTDPDLLVVSIQDLSQSQKWYSAIGQAIPKEFIKVESQYKNNNMLIVYAKASMKARLSAIEQGHLKFRSYYNAFVSNKSANYIRFNVDNSKLVFVGCQLEKGRQFTENRIKNLRQIHEYAFQVQEVGVQKSETILFDDTIFLMGNMNAHISPSFKSQIGRLCLQQSEKQLPILQKMLATDQFKRIRMGLLEYREYEEEPISFLPTYRFANGCFDPECSGWPDRIWFSSESKVDCLSYSTVEQLRQEHVPVRGKFLIEVKRINEEIRQSVGKSLLDRESVQALEELQKEYNQQRIPL